MELKAGLVLAAIFQFSSGFPVFGLALQLPPGHIYTYDYTTQITFNEPGTISTSQAKRNVGFKISCKVNLLPLFTKGNQMVVKLSIVKSRLDSIAKPDKHYDLKSLTRFPVLAHWEGTAVRQVYSAEKDPDWSVNLKKGIISLFQIQNENGQKREIDASGECLTIYKKEGLTITKTKAGCVSSKPSEAFSNVRPILGVSAWSSFKSTTTLAKDDVIQAVDTEETHVTRLNMRNTLAAMVQATQSLNLQKKVVGGTAVQASTADETVQVVNAREKLKLQGTTLETSYENQQCSSPDCDKVSKLIGRLRGALASTNMATVPSGDAFLKLVEAVRYSSQTIITGILKDPANTDIVPQLIDAITASQTSEAQGALMGFLDFNEEYDIKLQERYLLAAAFSTHPHEALLRDLMGLFQKDVPSLALREALGDALGAVVYTFCKTGKNNEKEIIQQILKLVQERLEGCSDAVCKTTYLRLIGNTGLPGTLDLLLKYAENGEDATISGAAIKAMRRLDRNLMSAKVLSVMRHIFYQPRRSYDTSVRCQALAVILQNQPSDDEIRSVIEATTDPEQTEFGMYVQQRLFQMAQRDGDIRDKIRKTLKDRSLSNYHVLARKGKALAFKEHLAQTIDVTAAYDMYVQNSKAGIMKRSGMDVDLTSDNSTLPLYSFGIFAAGLEGLLGEEVEEGQENVEATAGLALDLLDVALRPVTFFTGQSGLMSAIWSAPSELTNAVQTNLLLQDHRQMITLQNGMPVSLNVQGVVSMDLSGLVSISLWNKNCQSLIKNSGALVIRGSLGLTTPALRAELSFSADAATVIDFTTDVDFYDKIKMCLQMSRPAFVYRHHVRKYEHARGFKRSFIAKIRRTTNANAASYPLPKPNNDQCRAMHGQS